MDLSSLPHLGVGASLSFAARPDPAALAASRGGPQFVEYAGRVSVEEVLPEVERVRRAGAPVLFHPSYLNFCGTFPNTRPWLEETARHLSVVGSPWLAQDLAYCFLGASPGYSSQFGYFLPPIFSEASLEHAVLRVTEVAAAMPVPVLVEPPPLTFAAGRMPLLAFFGELSRRTGCGLLLDAGHLLSYELATGRRIDDELAFLPEGRVLEVHVAGGRLAERGGRTFYLDAHERPVMPETWALFERLLPRLPALRAVCFECEGATEPYVLDVLARLRASVLERTTSAPLAERVRRTEAA